MTTNAKSVPARKRITLERVFDAPIEDVWELWTTKEGIESWWGPDGFSVKVQAIDLRVGGELRYAMIAVAPDQVAFMKQAGMPISTDLSVRYTEIVENRLLRYMNVADFIPGVEPYEVETVVELHAGANGVRLLLTIEAMHDEHWTNMAVMGWENELGKLAQVLADPARRARAVSP